MKGVFVVWHIAAMTELAQELRSASYRSRDSAGSAPTLTAAEHPVASVLCACVAVARLVERREQSPQDSTSIVQVVRAQA